MREKIDTKTYLLGTLIWFVASLYYLYQYIVRVSPMVMVDGIRLDYQLDATTFGTLIAIATVFYSACQLPIGILSDLFGTRRMVLSSLGICVLGVGIFANTDSIYFAYISRAFIGLGSAAAFICVSKISSDWFPVHQKSFWFALTVMMGTIGAVLGGKPLAQLVMDNGWRDTMKILTWLGLGILTINIVFLRSKKQNVPSVKNNPHPQNENMDRQALWTQIKHVFSSRVCWLYAIVGMGMYLSISVFADLWGVSFFQQKFNVELEVAAHSVTMAYYGTCAGVLIMAILNQTLFPSRWLIGGSALMVSILMTLIVFGEGLSFTTATILMVLVGFFAGGEVLCFSQSCQHMDVRVAATVTGFLNFIITLGAACMQKICGSALDWFWSGDHALNIMGGDRLYSLSDYQSALLIVIAISLISVVLAFFLPKDID